MTYSSEKDVKKRVKQLLDQHNWFWWMTPANGFGKSGVSDFSAIRGGVFLAVETKFGSNKPTALQVGYLNSITAESGFGFVVSDRTIGAFEEWLVCFDRATAAVAGEAKPTNEDGAAMLDAMRTLTELLA